MDADLLEEGKRNLLERLERDGYFDAKVNYTTETREVQGKDQQSKGTEEVITYHIERGDRHRLVGIEIIWQPLLQHRIAAQPAASIRSGVRVARKIQPAADRIRRGIDAGPV